MDVRLRRDHLQLVGRVDRPWDVPCAGLSRAAFARRFASVVGEPPLTYLTRWRMTTAAQLLRTTDKTLAQVASAIGYGSPFAFAKAFQREYATTPGGYRADAAG